MREKALTRLRKEMDAVDKVILSALAKRANLSKKIGKYKLGKGLRALDKTRRKQLLKSRVAMAKAMNISSKLVNQIFVRIHKESIAIQKRIKP